MSYVKLDTGILDSSLWCDSEARFLFITALLMATPKEIREPEEQIEARSLKPTGWVVPPGWYGFIEASGLGIINRAGVEREAGLAALERLGSPEPESRSQEFDGRRLVRVNGGYLLLNYIKYREKDHTSAERQRRFRERKKGEAGRKPLPPAPPVQQPHNSNAVTSRNITHADADADADVISKASSKQPKPSPEDLFGSEKPNIPKATRPSDDWFAWRREHPRLFIGRSDEDGNQTQWQDLLREYGAEILHVMYAHVVATVPAGKGIGYNQALRWLTENTVEKSNGS